MPAQQPAAVTAPEEEQKKQVMTDAELVSFCEMELASCIGGRVGDSDADITLPIDYYLGRKPGLSEVRARDNDASKYVSQDVRDGIEATVAEIMPAFSTSDIGYYDPVDEDDEKQAQAETDIVNYLFMEEYDGFTILQTALKDALMHRNCTGKVFWDERVEVEYETFEDVLEMALPDLLKPENDDQTIEVVEAEVTEQGSPQSREAVVAMTNDKGKKSPEDGQIMQQAMLNAQDKFTIKVKRMTKVGRPVIINVPPEQARVKSSHNKVFLGDCGFVAHETIETQSSLIAQGYDPDVIAKLPDYHSSTAESSRARQADEKNKQAAHKSVRNILVHECYAEVDYDGDGIAERRKIVVSNGHLLGNDEFNGVALVGGAVCIMPHKYKAISMFERLRDIQDAKTPVMRSIIDGVQLSSNPRLGVITGKANVDDILTSRTGGVVRVDHRDAVFDMPNPQIPQSSYVFLEHMDGVRRDRGGGAVDQAAQAHKVQGQGGDHSLERIMSQMELGNALLARNLGETFIRGVFMEIHSILRKHYPRGEKIQAKIGGKWVSTIPSNWRKRTKVTIQVGASLAERARQSSALAAVIKLQDEMMKTGHVMYDPARHYSAVADYVKLSGMRAPERYFVDPTTQEGQTKTMMKKQQQEAIQKREQAVQQLMVEAQDKLAEAEKMKAKADNDANLVKFQNEQLQATIDRLQTELDALAKSGELQFKYAQLSENVALKLTELEMKSKGQLDKQKESNKPGAPVGEAGETEAEENEEDESGEE